MIKEKSQIKPESIKQIVITISILDINFTKIYTNTDHNITIRFKLTQKDKNVHMYENKKSTRQHCTDPGIWLF